MSLWSLFSSIPICNITFSLLSGIHSVGLLTRSLSRERKIGRFSGSLKVEKNKMSSLSFNRSSVEPPSTCMSRAFWLPNQFDGSSSCPKYLIKLLKLPKILLRCPSLLTNVRQIAQALECKLTCDAVFTVHGFYKIV